MRELCVCDTGEGRIITNPLNYNFPSKEDIIPRQNIYMKHVRPQLRYLSQPSFFSVYLCGEIRD